MYSTLYLVRKVLCGKLSEEQSKIKAYDVEDWYEEPTKVDVYKDLDKRIMEIYDNPLEECSKYNIKHPESLKAKEREEKKKQPAAIERAEFIKQKKMEQNVKAVDKAINKLELDVEFNIGKVEVAVTHKIQGEWKKMADGGISGQRVKIEKKGKTIAGNVFGITFDTYYDFQTLKMVLT